MMLKDLTSPGRWIVLRVGRNRLDLRIVGAKSVEKVDHQSRLPPPPAARRILGFGGSQ